MLTVLIGLLYIFVAIMSVDKGELGILAGATILLVILILMADGDRKDTRAFLNLRDYWAKGGPQAEKRNIAEEQRKLDAEAMVLNREINRTIAEWLPERKSETNRPRGEEWERFIERESMLDGKCRKCGRAVNVSEFEAEGSRYLFCKCDFCKDVNVIPK